MVQAQENVTLIQSYTGLY